MANKFIAFFLALILGVMTLAGCSGADPNDPNLGLWKATRAEQAGMNLDLKALFGQGCTIELKAKNACVVNIDGAETTGGWSLLSGYFAISCGDLKLLGILTKGVLTIQNFGGVNNLNIIFEKEGGHPDATDSTPPTDERPESAGGIDLSEGLEWWDGQWYIGDEMINYKSMLDAIADSVVGEEEAHIHSALPVRAFS